MLHLKSLVPIGILILLFGSFVAGRLSVSADELNVPQLRAFVSDLPAGPMVVPGIYRFEWKIDGEIIKRKIVTTVDQ